MKYLMTYRTTLFLGAFFLVSAIFAENTETPEKEPVKAKSPKEFFDPETERPPFHIMSEFQNGYLALSHFSIPVLRNEKIVCKVEIELVIQSENVQSSLNLYRQRRLLQDKIYTYLYQMFDIGWQENWHPEIEPIRKNLIKALQSINSKKAIKNVLITSFIIKNS